MKKVLFVTLVVTVAVVMMACAPKATTDDCNNACQKFAELESAANPPAPIPNPVQGVNEQFAKKHADLQKQIADAVAVFDKEMADKLAKVKKDKDKAKITDEYKVKKDAKTKEFAPQMDQLMKDREQTLKAAQGAYEKAQQEAKAAQDQKVQDCSTKCVADGTSKPKTDCQSAAATLDDFNKCQ